MVGLGEGSVGVDGDGVAGVADGDGVFGVVVGEHVNDVLCGVGLFVHGFLLSLGCGFSLVDWWGCVKLLGGFVVVDFLSSVLGGAVLLGNGVVVCERWWYACFSWLGQGRVSSFGSGGFHG